MAPEMLHNSIASPFVACEGATEPQQPRPSRQLMALAGRLLMAASRRSVQSIASSRPGMRIRREKGGKREDVGRKKSQVVF